MFGAMKRHSAIAFYWTCLVTWMVVHHEYVRSQEPGPNKDIYITQFKGEKNVTFSCTVRNIGTRKVIWTRLPLAYPISVGDLMFLHNDRHTVTNAGGTSNLTITNVEQGDVGVYQCRLTGNDYVVALSYLFYPKQEDSEETFLHDTPSEVRSKTFRNVTLLCYVHNLNMYEALWQNSRGEIVAWMRETYSRPRFGYAHTRGIEWSLKIAYLQPNDFGTYTCFVTSKPIMSHSVELINEDEFEPRFVPDGIYQPYVLARVGETVNMTCNFKANPPATVTWRKSRNGRLMRHDIGAGSTLTLTSLTPQHGGDYICTANNGRETTAQAKTRLVVQIPHPPMVNQEEHVMSAPTAATAVPSQNKTGVCKGSSVFIACSAEGYPRPTVKWQRHATILKNDPKYWMEMKTLHRFASLSRLLIRAVGRGDLGIYICTGVNSVGSGSATQELYENPVASCTND